jgi:hypothetical protein
MRESGSGGQSYPNNRWFEHVIHAKSGGDLDPGDLYYDSGKAGNDIDPGDLYYHSGKAGNDIDPGDLYFTQSNTYSQRGLKGLIIAWQSMLLQRLIRTPSIFQ